MTGLRVPEYAWYDVVKAYTERLVRIRSVSPSEGEVEVAREVLRLLHEGGLEGVYTASGLDPIEGDPHGRQNAYALLHGQSTRTVVLLGHIDTVGTADYGRLEPYAIDPDALAAHVSALSELAPDITSDLEAHPGDWMFGRGAVDMKSGVAANIAVIRRLAEMTHDAQPPLSIVFLATPDEENESAGVLAAVRLLARLRDRYGLDYVGAINTDYVTSLYPDDPHRYVYTGTIGKLLPSFFVVGHESHVGAPFDGVDANLLAAELIRDLSMCEELCDMVRGQVTPPPVTLRATDLKSHYDAQLPYMAYFYLNVLTFTTQPGELLERLRHRAEASLARALWRLDEAEHRWGRANGEGSREARMRLRSGTVLTYAELRVRAVQRFGEAYIADELAQEWDRWPAELDKRERSLHLVRRLWSLSGVQGPAVVLYYSPPYYPHVAATRCALHDVIADVAAAHSDLRLRVREYFPFLSDMSYLRLDADVDVSGLTMNMPVWQEAGASPRPGAYSVPFEAIRALNLPVINLGPYGHGAHQRGERVLMSYAFTTLPMLLFETIERLAERVAHGER